MLDCHILDLGCATGLELEENYSLNPPAPSKFDCIESKAISLAQQKGIEAKFAFIEANFDKLQDW